MSTQIDQLNTELKAAQAALDAALMAGEPSRSHRNEVARLEAELATAQQAEAAAQAASAAEEAAKAQADALALASTQQIALSTTEADAALGEIAAEQPVAAVVDVDPLLLSAAEGVVLARTALERAQLRHGELSKAAGRIQAAVTRKTEERDAIKARALAKTATAEDGLAILTIDEDLADLEHSLSAARDKANAAIPAVEQGALAAAEQNLARVRGQLAYSLAEARLKRVEQLFMAAHSEMVAAHQAGGATSYLGSGRYVPAREFRDLVLSQRAYWGI